MSERNERVVAFLKGLNIKTAAFGGFDKTAVFDTLRELSDLYEAEMAAERGNAQASMAAADRQISELQDQLAKNGAELSAAKSRLTDTTDMMREYQRKNDECDRLCKEADAESRRVLDDAHSSADRLKQDAKAESERILSDARNEKERIVQQARIDAMRQKTVIFEDLEATKREKEMIYSELSLVREQIQQLLTHVPGSFGSSADDKHGV